MSFEKLFEKGQIGPLCIRNRACMAPMGTDLADMSGNATDRLIAYYAERARGGIGLIINEYTGVDDIDSIPSQHNLRMARDYNIAPAEELTRSVHRYGAKIFAQLHHGGATSKRAFTGRQNLSPSGIPISPGGDEPREMSLEDIRRVQQKFVDAAVRCKKAGYDGVELHGAHGYLITQFLNSYYNRRNDEYGGSTENRCRFLTEIIAGIRAKLGNYPISVRMCGDEMTAQEGFLTLEEGLAIAQCLERAGIDCINISMGSSWNANANCEPYTYTPGWKKHIAKTYKELLSIPVIATNTIKDPGFADELLREGVCDFVALGRSQFADPDFMNKAKAGKSDTIRRCIGCLYCRERLLGSALPVECSVNPRLGREASFPWKDLQLNGAGRRVVVAGGGPGGLECAIILAKRGFAVDLYEQTDALGGTLNIAKLPPHKENLQELIDVMELEARSAGVTIHLGCPITPAQVAALHPLAVFVATGAPVLVPSRIEGIERALIAEDVIESAVHPGKNVVLVGSGMTGLECAEMLVDAGCELSIVEMRPELGEGIFPAIRNELLGHIQAGAPKIFTSHKLQSVGEGVVRIVDVHTRDGVELPCDSVVLAMGYRAGRETIEAFEQTGLQVIAVGSVEEPGRIVDAIHDGFERAWVFEAI